MIPTEFKWENIYRAYLDCRKNKRTRPDALLFEVNAEENLGCLLDELVERSYRPSFCTCFVSKKPKLREIFAADFRDRIVHHLIVRYLEGIWEPKFIFDSYASRVGKGTHLAVNRLQGFLRKATKNETKQAFYMQLDIRSFFMSIDKNKLFELIATNCPSREMYWLARKIIFHDPTDHYIPRSPLSLIDKIPKYKSLFHSNGKKGLPIGNLTSQFFANIYLNSLDQYVKHALKCRFYMRYVDDFVLIAERKEMLFEWKGKITEYLHGVLRLELNQSRTKILPVKNGIDFLGYIARPGYILSRKRVVNNLKTKLKDFERKLITMQAGVKSVTYCDETLDDLFSSLNSYLAHFRHASTYNLRQSIFEKYSYLNYFFKFDPRGKLKRMYLPKINFANLRAQYLYFLKKYFRSMIFFQVGCFYEFYGAQASRAAKYMKLNMIKRKYGFRRRCGIGEKALKRYIELALKEGWSVVLVRQTGHLLLNIAERRVRIQYIKLKP